MFYDLRVLESGVKEALTISVTTLGIYLSDESMQSKDIYILQSWCNSVVSLVVGSALFGGR